MAPTPEQLAKLLQGEILIDLEWLPDGVIGANGSVFIEADPSVVWRMLTDYNHLDKTMPKVVASKLVEENNHTKIIEQSGRSGIFIFEMTVHFTLKVEEVYPERLYFSQVSGDFKVYEGEWRLEALDGNNGPGTLLTYQAEIKPDFFAPQFVVSFVQSQDLPAILKGVRRYCEAHAKN
ncbi:MAG TPA: cyclase [Chlorobaculum parvum]|uniref:Cyclase n=1 Tax=Chlorobaculum parvum TaxID=274539 RepID=A0A7C5DHC9_9CHLB|nr:cyclase [Chlorobaculum parvum]